MNYTSKLGFEALHQKHNGHQLQTVIYRHPRIDVLCGPGETAADKVAVDVLRPDVDDHGRPDLYGASGYVNVHTRHHDTAEAQEKVAAMTR